MATVVSGVCTQSNLTESLVFETSESSYGLTLPSISDQLIKLSTLLVELLTRLGACPHGVLD